MYETQNILHVINRRIFNIYICGFALCEQIRKLVSLFLLCNCHLSRSELLQVHDTISQSFTLRGQKRLTM